MSGMLMNSPDPMPHLALNLHLIILDEGFLYTLKENTKTIIQRGLAMGSTRKMSCVSNDLHLISRLLQGLMIYQTYGVLYEGISIKQ